MVGVSYLLDKLYSYRYAIFIHQIFFIAKGIVSLVEARHETTMSVYRCPIALGNLVWASFTRTSLISNARFLGSFIFSLSTILKIADGEGSGSYSTKLLQMPISRRHTPILHTSCCILYSSSDMFLDALDDDKGSSPSTSH